jgi:putative Ca2+/H+ antiporter (TMEM165/GDT1 family)
MDWGIVFTTFGMIFVAELGDKTQLAVLAQTCKYHRPWAVFLGASLALAAVTGLGAVGGQVLGQIIPTTVLQGMAALAFVVMGVLVGREAAQAVTGESAQETGCDDPDDESEESLAGSTLARDWKTFGSTFGLLFVAEMGDKTQLAIVGLAGKHSTLWPVFIGGTVALTAVTALGVIGGEGLSRVMPKRVLLWISATVFVVMGIVMGLGIW